MQRALTWLGEGLPAFLLPKAIKDQTYFLGAYSNWGLVAAFMVARLTALIVWIWAVQRFGWLIGLPCGAASAWGVNWLCVKLIFAIYPVWRYLWLPIVAALLVALIASAA